MLSKLDSVYKRYQELTVLIGDYEVLKDMELWKKYTKEHAEIQPTAETYAEYLKTKTEAEQAKELIELEADAEMRELLAQEIENCEEKLQNLHEQLKILLLPKDPNDNRNVIMEIRAGAGGDEAGLFGADLYRMYVRFAEKQRWKTEEIENNSTELGGIKEVVFSVSGKDVYSKLKFESGVHRVQRVPETESQGRVHTSTVTVAVLPEAEDVEVQINENDLKIDTYRSGGAGGQHVNKTESSIRITHLPTGIVVTCQDERSQIKNREKAMRVLKSRLYDHFNSIYQKDYADNRKSQVGTGDRSERIRTYNYPQGRITDHRIGLTLYSLDTFLEGEIEEMVNALGIADREAKLSGQQ